MLILLLLISPFTHGSLRPKAYERVTAGTYGSLTEVPVVTVDGGGVITDASTVLADTAAIPSTYATRDSDAASAFGSLTLGGTSQQTLQLVSGSTPSAGIQFGSDVSPTANMYRSAAGSLQTDGMLIVAPIVTTAMPGVDSLAGNQAGLLTAPVWNTIPASGAFRPISSYVTNYITNPLLGNAAVVSAAINNGGSGYVIGDLLLISGGNANSQFQVTEVDVLTGAITGLAMTRGGSGYISSNNTATTGGSGADATVDTTVSTTFFSGVYGMRIRTIGTPPTPSYSTMHLGDVTGIDILAPDLGNGPMVASHYNRGIVVNSLTNPCLVAGAITTNTISGGSARNVNIDVGPTNGASGGNTGVSVGLVSGSATSNTGITIQGVGGASASNIGISINSLSGGNVIAGLKIPAASGSAGATLATAIWLTDTGGGGSGGGIQWGNDAQPRCNLYRNAAGILKTDGMIQCTPIRPTALTTTALIGSVQWNQTTGTMPVGIGVLGTNNLNGKQLATNGVATFVINSGGTGYILNDLLTISGGSGTAQVKVTSVSAGVILTVVLTRPGSGYAIAIGATLTGGAGTGATLDILSINATPFTIVVGVQGQGFDATSQFVTPTVTYAIGLRAVAPVLGAGPVVVTNIIGIDVPAHSITTTNSYALRLAAPTGGTAINQALNFVASALPSGGITFGSDTSPSTNLYRSAAKTLKTDADFIARKHYTINAALPTTAAGTGAGTGPTIVVAAGSTDCKMQISVTTGTAPAAAATIFTLTYNAAFTNALNLGNGCWPVNAAAASLSGTSTPYVGSETLSAFTWKSNAVALTASTTYVWNCQACT